MNEFQLIETYFKNLLPDTPALRLGIGDDAAVFSPTAGQELILSVDTLVVDRHFLSTDMPAHIAHKALAVNLSDLAAMGAMPSGFLLALTLPEADPHWLENFAFGLKNLAQEFNLPLLGGDTTKGPLSISITVLGQAPKEKILTRSGAKPGDTLFVSGELGASAMVVKQLHHKLNIPIAEFEEALSLYQKPKPQIELGLALRDIASSCIDISDGLAQDCRHILQQSNCGANIDLAKLPIHPTVKRSMPLQEAQQLALTGGDDYQLLFTASEDKLANLPVEVTKIGVITSGDELVLNEQGKNVHWDLQGWDHFQ
jgi:thiamine-monophosphate kinase